MSGSRSNNDYPLVMTLQSLLGLRFENVNAYYHKQLKAWNEKENKQALLDEYSQNPWQDVLVDGMISQKTAFDYFLCLGRVSGKLCDETDSSREYVQLKSAKNILCRDQKDHFMQERALPLNRDDDENPYYQRALQHKRAGRHRRAMFDFQVARDLFQQQREFVQAQNCDRQLIVCYYQAGMDLRAYTALQTARVCDLPLQPMDKLMGALAFMRNNAQHPGVLPPFNPLQVLCEALAESQDVAVVALIVDALKKEGFILSCLEDYCVSSHGLLIDLLSFLPDEPRREVAASFIEQNKAKYEQALSDDEYRFIALYLDMKWLGQIPFESDDPCITLRDEETDHRSFLALPALEAHEAYPNSVVVAFKRVLQLIAADAHGDANKMLTRCLDINSAYLPARLLALQRSNESVNELMPEFRDIFSKYPHCIDACALAYSKAASQQKPDIALLCELADQLVQSYDKGRLEHPSDELKNIYNKAKLDLVVYAAGRRECIKRFLACDADNEEYYPKACAALKSKFQRGDRIFAEEVNALLESNKLVDAIRLCAANDKRTDVNNLLLKNKQTPVFLSLQMAQDEPVESSSMRWFRGDKMQGLFQEAFAPTLGRQSIFREERPMEMGTIQRNLYGVYQVKNKI